MCITSVRMQGVGLLRLCYRGLLAVGWLATIVVSNCGTRSNKFTLVASLIIVEDTNVDYNLQRIGSSNQPVRAHVDRLRLLCTFEAAEVDTAAPTLAPAARKKEYATKGIMGEKKHSAKA